MAERIMDQPKNKRIFLALVVFLLSSAGILHCSKKTAPPETRPAADFKTIQEESTDLKMDVKYPVTANLTVNGVLEGFAKGQVEEFKKDIAGVGSSFGMKNELTLSYAPYRFSDSILSYKFDVMTYT